MAWDEASIQMFQQLGAIHHKGRVRTHSNTVNEGRKVMRCSRFGNLGGMHVILNCERLEEVDFLSTWGRKWQLMDDVKGMWYTE